MSCKFTARLSVPTVRGVLGGPPKISGSVSLGDPSGPVADGVWNGGINTGIANGWYENNISGNVPDGCYRGGGLVDPYYEAIIKAAEAQGGGLYLFQLEHGEYAGEQVIWQEMSEINPWEPGQGLPQGKTYDLMGSGEYLGQSVSMRRPVDGVWDGVSTVLEASSDAVGGHLHQSKPSAWLVGLESISAITNAVIIATGRASSGEDGIEVRNNNAGILQYFCSGSTSRGTLVVANLGISPGLGWHVVGVSRSDTERKVISDGSVASSTLAPALYPDESAAYPLNVGARGASQRTHARYTYIAIYTREPTPYEISLHKRTP